MLASALRCRSTATESVIAKSEPTYTRISKTLESVFRVRQTAPAAPFWGVRYAFRARTGTSSSLLLTASVRVWPVSLKTMGGARAPFPTPSIKPEAASATLPTNSWALCASASLFALLRSITMTHWRRRATLALPAAVVAASAV